MSQSESKDSLGEVEEIYSDGALKEIFYHGAVNFVFHGAVGFAVAMFIFLFAPSTAWITVPLVTIFDMFVFSTLLGTASGLLGMALAIEELDETSVGEFAVIRFVIKLRRIVLGKKTATSFFGRENGKVYLLSKEWGLCVRSKQRLRDYLLFYQRYN